MSLPHSNAVDLLTVATKDILSAEQSAGVSATTTGNPFDISQRQLVTVEFVSSLNTNGTNTFSLDVSNDGTNWITSIAFQDPQSTTPTTYVTSKTLTANGTAGAIVPPGWRYIRAVVQILTSGTCYAFLHAAG